MTEDREIAALRQDMQNEDDDLRAEIRALKARLDEQGQTLNALLAALCKATPSVVR